MYKWGHYDSKKLCNLPNQVNIKDRKGQKQGWNPALIPKFTMKFSATHLNSPALSILLHEFWLSVRNHPLKMSSEDLFCRVSWSAFTDVWVDCGMEVKPGMRNPSRKKLLMNAWFTEMCSLVLPILSNAFTHVSVLTGRPITNDNFHFQIISHYLCTATVSKFNLFLTIQTVLF